VTPSGGEAALRAEIEFAQCHKFARNCCRDLVCSTEANVCPVKCPAVDPTE
jgi:hypothetical protein